ncbi:Mur ligase family protein [Halochromatium salexigens]|uniref:Uncharacterized protein n=1 Tax=Halochromatium salexigens TaxID=49447 RepID=A0AAJ0UEF3_HALSE|nr:UDP-N-acetylmuramoyl-L-alanyl-D-glutamate--2,6-diaminopimelate ligase [Halochromatium salexigens]MBK5929922.1 hypothetical protein [Halochromatium salexigens]
MSPDSQSRLPVCPLREVLNACSFAQKPDLDALDTSGLTNIQWRADRCSRSSLLCFQRFDDGRSDTEIIERYLLHSEFSALVINRPLDATQDQDARWAGASGPDAPRPDRLLQVGSGRTGSRQTGALQTEQLIGRPVFVTAPGAWSETLERLCDHFYPVRPAHWRIAGVTGTNGKTTTVKYLESILLAAGCRVLGIGTLGLTLNGQSLAETGFTSPPYIELRRILNDCRAQADTLVMEVSSHALHQGRVHGLRFAAAAWTNFSQDHLDYHGDEARYFAAKAMILEQLAEGVPLLTTSAEVEHRLRTERGPEVPVMRIAPPSLPAESTIGAPSDGAKSASLTANIDPVSSGDRTNNEPTSAVDFTKATNSTPSQAPELSAEALRASPFLALSYNRANYALACALATRLLGAEPPATWRALQPVPGRFDCYVYQQRTLVIDFAHTPDALENILGAIRAAFPGAGVLTLFGCGGDRDRAKRPLMGATVCRGSDQVILTSDNPRFEEPQAIADDVLAGMHACSTAPTVILDRVKAITALFDRLAERPSHEPWVAVIAGKGHEPYIDQNGFKRPYSDREQVLQNLRRLGWLG